MIRDSVFQNIYEENPDNFDNFFWGGFLGLGIGAGTQKKAKAELERAKATAELERAKAEELKLKAQTLYLKGQGEYLEKEGQNKKMLYGVLIFIMLIIAGTFIVIKLK